MCRGAMLVGRVMRPPSVSLVKDAHYGGGRDGFLADKDVARRAKVLRDHGMSKSRRYWHEVVGHNYRLTNLQAAIGLAQVERAEALVQQKRLIGQRYESKPPILPAFLPCHPQRLETALLVGPGPARS